jgi:protein-S-isoprenylcysteine O-methyltransferase Ste14
MHWLQILAWLVCGIYATIPGYWMMVHPFAERWRRARYKLAVLAPLWIAMWCIAWAASYPWSAKELYHLPQSWLAAPLLWAASVLTYVSATRSLSWRRVIGLHELEAPHDQAATLVTRGVHRLVRHPMYLGHICTMLGFAVGAGTVACFALLAFALATGAIMVVFEERELHRRFGSAWEQYCQQTPCLLPALKRSPNRIRR